MVVIRKRQCRSIFLIARRVADWVLSAVYRLFTDRRIWVFQREDSKTFHENMVSDAWKDPSTRPSGKRRSPNVIPARIEIVRLSSLNDSSGGPFYRISRPTAESTVVEMKKVCPELFPTSLDGSLQQAYQIRVTYLFSAMDVPQFLTGLKRIRGPLGHKHLYLDGRFHPEDLAGHLPGRLDRLTRRFEPFSAMLGPAGRKKINKWIAAGRATPETADAAEVDPVSDEIDGSPRALVVLKATGDVDRVLGMAGDELEGRRPVVLLISRDHDHFADDFFKRGGYPREQVLYYTEIKKHPARRRAAAHAARAMKPAFSLDTPAAHLVAAQMKDIVSVYIQADALDSIIRTWRPEVVIGCFEKTNWVPLLAAGDPRPRIVSLQHGFIPRLHLLDLMDIDSVRVWDQPSADTVIADGIPPDRIMIVENPHRRQLKEAVAAFTGTERYRQWQDWKAGRTLVAIMGQPDTTGAIAPQDNRALARAVGAALKQRSDMVAVLRPHPRQPDAGFGPELSRLAASGRARVAPLDELELGELLSLADVVVGIHSTALADAWAIGVPAFSFDFQGRFDALDLDARQVTQIARTEREAVRLLKHFGRRQGRQPQPQPEPTPQPRGHLAKLLSRIRFPRLPW